MTTTLDEEYRRTLLEFARATHVDERFALNTVRVVSDNLSNEDELWTMSAEEAEKRARKYRLVAAYALRGAAICDDRADDERPTLVELTAP